MFSIPTFVSRRSLGLVLRSGLAVFALTACGKIGSNAQSARIADKLLPQRDAPGACQTQKDNFFAEAYRQIDLYGVLPSAEAVRSDLEAIPGDEKVEKSGLRRELASVYSEIAQEVNAAGEKTVEADAKPASRSGPTGDSGADSESDAMASADPGDADTDSSLDTSDDASATVRFERLKRLAQLELGDRTTDAKARAQDALEAKLARVSGLFAQAYPECGDGAAAPSVSPTPSNALEAPAKAVVAADADPSRLFESFRQAYHPAVYGAYKTLSVAYQTCGALSLPALTLATPSVQGITITGTHASGTGKKRVVSSVSALMSTNPYYKSQVSPGAGCFTQTKNPLIYDYGGKPYVTSNASTELDLFTSSGSGTAALGIDCSGYVSSSILVGGLRLRKGTTSKAYQSLGINSAMFSKPESNGVSCLKSIAVSATDTIRPGDVLASSGHVIMVDSVTADPWGIAGAKSIADCTAAKVNSTKFGFTIVQSAPVLGGIGIDRIQASSYLNESSGMKSALNSYALAFCRARFGTVATPTGLPATLVRHLGTAECKDTRITLKQENCMQSCPAPATLSSMLSEPTGEI